MHGRHSMEAAAAHRPPRLGFALETVLLLLVMFSIIILAGLSAVTTLARTSNADYRGARASYAAEGGADDVMSQLDAAMQRIAAEGRGVLLYLNQEGRGIGLANKLRAYALQDQGLDTVEANERLGFKADQRDYGIGAQILRDLGVRTMRLLTNNPRKFVGLQGYGLSVASTVPLEIPASESTRRYLKVKKDKLGHRLKSV